MTILDTSFDMCFIIFFIFPLFVLIMLPTFPISCITGLQSCPMDLSLLLLPSCGHLSMWMGDPWQVQCEESAGDEWKGFRYQRHVGFSSSPITDLLPLVHMQRCPYRHCNTVDRISIFFSHLDESDSSAHCT